jgi:hypothetical protein
MIFQIFKCAGPGRSSDQGVSDPPIVVAPVGLSVISDEQTLIRARYAKSVIY